MAPAITEVLVASVPEYNGGKLRSKMRKSAPLLATQEITISLLRHLQVVGNAGYR